MIKNLVFGAVVCIVTILVGLIAKTDSLMIVFASIISVFITCQFMLAILHEQRWEKKKIKIIMNLPWKVVAIYPFWTAAITSFILGVKVFPGNPMTNFICFMSGVAAAFILGSILWAQRPKVEVAEKTKGIF